MKAYQIKTCPKCCRKRRVRKRPKLAERWVKGRLRLFEQWTCSQGHSWERMLKDLEELNEFNKAFIAPYLENLMNSESPFYSKMKH